MQNFQESRKHFRATLTSSYQTRRGWEAWEADIYYKEKIVGDAHDDGMGGAVSVWIKSPYREEFTKLADAEFPGEYERDSQLVDKLIDEDEERKQIQRQQEEHQRLEKDMEELKRQKELVNLQVTCRSCKLKHNRQNINLDSICIFCQVESSFQRIKCKNCNSCHTTFKELCESEQGCFLMYLITISKVIQKCETLNKRLRTEINMLKVVQSRPVPCFLKDTQDLKRTISQTFEESHTQQSHTKSRVAQVGVLSMKS